MLGIELLRHGNPQQAADAFRRVLQHSPRDPCAWCNLGIALMQLGQWEEAEQATRHYVQLAPEDPVGPIRLGVILRRRGAHEDALILFQRAIELDPRQVVAHKELGRALMRVGRLREARQAFKEAIRLKSSHADAWCGLGEVCEEENKLGLAIRVYSDALPCVHSNRRGPIYARLGLVYGKLGDWLSSRIALEKAIAKGESDPRLTYALGHAYNQLGEYTAARQQELVLESIGSDLRRRLREEIARSAEDLNNKKSPADPDAE